jgi:F-type H+-transporting ATPase subunit a
VKRLGIIILVCVLLTAIFAVRVNAEPSPASEAGSPAATPEAGHPEASQALVPAAAPTVFHIGLFPVTNSMIYTWVVAVVIFLIVRAGTRRMKEVPSGTQNFIEATVEGLEEMTAGVLEPKVARWVFPFAATFFIFILVSNIMGLLPGVGSIGFGVADNTGSLTSSWPRAILHAEAPLFRPPTADANMTVAMALIFLVMGLYWAYRYNGVFGFIKHTFGVKGETNKWSYVPLALLFLFIGAVELFSILFVRPLALAMRLYGNILGGESVVTDMLTHSPLGLGALPFYFFELFVAVVQALVFALLVIAFVGTMCMHDEEAAAAH